jgi:hypothetical protein
MWPLLGSSVSAQTADAAAAQTVPAAGAVLAEAKTALERAHFDAAEKLLADLLTRTALSARERNDALELFAIVQIAERKDAKARETLHDLLRRDPEHHRRMHDPGPAVDAAFARIKQSPTTALNVPLRFSLSSDPSRRLVLRLDLGEGRDAVDSVHVFVHGEPSEPPSHLVSTVHSDQPLRLVLPAAPHGSRELGVYLEARAPSGAVIGRVGEATGLVYIPLPHVDLPAATCTVTPKPLRREWWVWTTVGLVVSAIVVGSAVSAH